MERIAVIFYLLPSLASSEPLPTSPLFFPSNSLGFDSGGSEAYSWLSTLPPYQIL